MKLASIASFVVVAGLASSASAFVVQIDDYQSAAFTLTVDYTNAPISTTASASQAGVSGVLGGHRSSILEYIGLPPADVEPEDRSRLRVVTKLSGSLSLSTDTGVTPKVTMTYGGPAFNMSTDLSTGAATAIAIDFLRNDQAMPVTIVLSSALGTPNAATASVTVNVPASTNPFQSLFSFADFVASNPTINFADIDRIVVEYNAPSGSDFAADGIGTIPTPGAAALVALGGLVASRRRRA